MAILIVIKRDRLIFIVGNKWSSAIIYPNIPNEVSVLWWYETRVRLATDRLFNHFSYVFRYTNKIKELSAVYHDRPVPPAQELVHWVEHVVKTRGGVHLRSPASMVPWYQKLYLDLALVLVIICLILKYIFVILKDILLKKRKEKVN